MNTKALIAAVSAASILLCGCKQKEETRTKAPVRVKTEVLTSAPTTDGRSYVGVVEEAQATAVSFTTMGTVRRVYVSEGQAVSRGQLIAEMDDMQARNLLEGAQAAVRQAEDALQRYSLLHERGSLTEAQWVEIESKVAQARSQLAIARKNVADCRLIAPVGGIIGRKNVSAGETAMPSQAIVTILDISSVKVKFSVPESDVTSITPQTRTRISVEAIGREFEGGRIEKGVQADMLTHTYDMRVRVINKERALLPGMVAEVRPATDLSRMEGGRTDTNEHKERLSLRRILPLTAVQRRADGSLFVWTVAADSTAHRTPVSIGSTVGNRLEVTEGLAEGQRIVTEGYQKLSEGTKVVY